MPSKIEQSLHYKIYQQSRGAFDVTMHRNTWYIIYKEYEKLVMALENIQSSLKNNESETGLYAYYHAKDVLDRINPNV